MTIAVSVRSQRRNFDPPLRISHRAGCLEGVHETSAVHGKIRGVAIDSQRTKTEIAFRRTLSVSPEHLLWEIECPSCERAGLELPGDSRNNPLPSNLGCAVLRTAPTITLSWRIPQVDHPSAELRSNGPYSCTLGWFDLVVLQWS